jgi:hypothetical protein
VLGWFMVCSILCGERGLLRWGGRAVATVAERATLSTDLPCQLVPPGP